MGRQSRLKAERRAERERRDELRRAARELGAQEGRRRGCLICRRSDGGFTTEEHIIPESLGNTEKVLPPGVVCDRCNHEVCAPLDEALCTFAPVQMLRTMRQQPTKSGKYPSATFDNGRLTSTGPGALSIELASEKWWLDLPSPTPGTKSFSFTAQRSNEITPGRLSRVHRALVKQVLEFVWLDSGERALSEMFDRERALILRGGHRGYILTLRNVSFLNQELQHGMEYAEHTRTADGHPVLLLAAAYWGLPFVTDTLLPEPTGQLPDNVLVWTF